MKEVFPCLVTIVTLHILSILFLCRSMGVALQTLQRSTNTVVSWLPADPLCECEFCICSDCLTLPFLAYTQHPVHCISLNFLILIPLKDSEVCLTFCLERLNFFLFHIRTPTQPTLINNFVSSSHSCLSSLCQINTTTVFLKGYLSAM